MARSLQIPMRYFIAKRSDGPALVIAHRIETIRQWLEQHGYLDQFHPSYTRMVPAHHLTEIHLVGCPDPNPRYRRFFDPQCGEFSSDVDELGQQYIRALAQGIRRWLAQLPDGAPIGISFSGGIDSGSVFLVALHEMLQLGMNPARLKAFTLAVDGTGDDIEQAREFVRAVDHQLYWEPIEVSRDVIDVREAVRVIEDYKPSTFKPAP